MISKAPKLADVLNPFTYFDIYHFDIISEITFYDMYVALSVKYISYRLVGNMCNRQKYIKIKEMLFE